MLELWVPLLGGEGKMRRDGDGLERSLREQARRRPEPKASPFSASSLDAAPSDGRAHTRDRPHKRHTGRAAAASRRKNDRKSSPRKTKQQQQQKQKEARYTHRHTHRERERERERERLSRMLLPVSPCSRRRKTRFKARRLV